MTKRLLIPALLLSAITFIASAAYAQEQKAAVSRPPAVTLMVDVIISRFSGEKLLSSTPYMLGVMVGDRASLRMGGDVPVPSTTLAPAPPKDDATPKPVTTATPITSYGYRSIGTSIDVTAMATQEGQQYRIAVTIDENSIYPPEMAPPTTKGAPAFRNFKSTNVVSLRDGQKLDYLMATDRLTGEVYRVSVKMTVEK